MANRLSRRDFRSACVEGAPGGEGAGPETGMGVGAADSLPGALAR